MARSSVDKAKQIVGKAIGLSNEEWEQVDALARERGISKSAACRELILAGTNPSKPGIVLEDDILKGLAKASSMFNKSSAMVANEKLRFVLGKMGMINGWVDE